MSFDKKCHCDVDGIDFREVVNNLTDGILVTDGEGKILFVNPSYCRRLDVESEELVGRSVFDVAREGRIFRHSVCADVIRSGRRISGAGYMRTARGRRVNGYAAAEPVFDEDGNIRMVVSSMTDVEELRIRYEQFRGTDPGEDAIQINDCFTGTEDRQLGSDPAMEKVIQAARAAAASDLPVLIAGEMGTGKEVLADFILAESGEPDRPYVKVNCQAIPVGLLESELFGSVGQPESSCPDDDKAGLFELADGGTILLGEIDSLPAQLQQTLVEVIQSGRVPRSGGGESTRLNFRVLASVEDDIREKVESGGFSRELFEIFSGGVIDIPPLRERKGDIIPLAKRFFEQFCEKYGRTLSFPENVCEDLENYSWPENVRELKNIIEYLVICSEGDSIEASELAELLDIPAYGRPSKVGLHEAVAQYEKQMIEDALIHCGGVRRAAAYLKVDPSTISRKAKKYGIPLNEQQP